MKKLSFIVAAFATLLTSCDTTQITITQPNNGESDNAKPMSINISRSAESDFEENFQLGLYVVNLDSYDNSLQNNGNHVDNMCFTYHESWIPDSPIYWKDSNTWANFYCYAPYNDAISDVHSHIFAVSEDQNNYSDYKNSDFLWGKATDIEPLTTNVNINVSHKTSRIAIILEAGDGYEESELENAVVTICNVKNMAEIDLESGEVKEYDSGRCDIHPYYEDGKYYAHIAPQYISTQDLIKVEVNNSTYILRQSVKFESGKHYNCTISIAKSSQGINIGIKDWDVSDNDFGGIVM